MGFCCYSYSTQLLIIALFLFVLKKVNHALRHLLSKPKFNGKTVFITGGSSGIGEQLCKRFIELGAKKVIIAARRLNELERVKKECKYPEKVEVF